MPRPAPSLPQSWGATEPQNHKGRKTPSHDARRWPVKMATTLLANLLEMGNGSLGKLGLVVILNHHHRKNGRLLPELPVCNIELILDKKPLHHFEARPRTGYR